MGRVSAGVARRVAALRRCETVGSGDLADQLRGGQCPTASLGQQLRRVALDERGEFALEFADAAGACCDVAGELARDPDTGGLLGACKSAGDLSQPLAGVQRPGRDFELRP